MTDLIRGDRFRQGQSGTLTAFPPRFFRSKYCNCFNEESQSQCCQSHSLWNRYKHKAQIQSILHTIPLRRLSPMSPLTLLLHSLRQIIAKKMPKGWTAKKPFSILLAYTLKHRNFAISKLKNRIWDAAAKVCKNCKTDEKKNPRALARALALLYQSHYFGTNWQAMTCGETFFEVLIMSFRTSVIVISRLISPFPRRVVSPTIPFVAPTFRTSPKKVPPPLMRLC